MKARTLLAVCITAASVVACGGNDGSSFKDVLPDSRVLVNLPEGGQTSRTGEWSEYYVFTKDVTDGVNGLAGYVLGVTAAIVSTKPASYDDATQTATWGPYAKELDAVSTQLVVTHNDDDSYDWHYDQRPKNDETAAWTTVVTGHVEPGATHEASRGDFVVDWSTMATMDPSVHATGTFTVDYDIAADGVSGTAGFNDVTWDGGPARDASYDYAQTNGGEGSMDLVVDADVNPENGLATDEQLSIHSRWTSTGMGRGDAQVTGGDLGSIAATASDCWGEDFKTSYWIDNWEPAEEGDASTCAYADAVYAGE